MTIYAYAAAAAVCFLILYLACWYAAWETWNDRRRSDRLCQRNLWRQTGGGPR